MKCLECGCPVERDSIREDLCAVCAELGIVHRLQRMALPVCLEAADEIERLRKRLVQKQISKAVICSR